MGKRYPSYADGEKKLRQTLREMAERYKRIERTRSAEARKPEASVLAKPKTAPEPRSVAEVKRDIAAGWERSVLRGMGALPPLGDRAFQSAFFPSNGPLPEMFRSRDGL